MLLKIAVISVLVAVSLGRDALPDATDDKFLADCLASHNAKRALHINTPLLTADPALNEYAKSRCYDVTQQEYLDEDHAGLNQDLYGENLYWSASSVNSMGTCSDAVNNWYAEIQNYDYSNPGPNPGEDTNSSLTIGHFAQVVWKSAATFGCARSYGLGDITQMYETYVCCDYQPPVIGSMGYQYPNGTIVWTSQYPINIQPLK